MNVGSVALISLVMMASAGQGIRVTKAQRDRRLFDNAVNVAKVYRFGSQRKSRFDNWAYERAEAATLTWERQPRAWFQSEVPVKLTIRIDKRVLQTYNLLVDLDAKSVASADPSTKPKLDELRRWARRPSESGSLGL